MPFVCVYISCCSSFQFSSDKVKALVSYWIWKFAVVFLYGQDRLYITHWYVLVNLLSGPLFGSGFIRCKLVHISCLIIYGILFSILSPMLELFTVLLSIDIIVSVTRFLLISLLSWQRQLKVRHQMTQALVRYMHCLWPSSA